MSLSKRRFERQETEGWNSVGGAVCPKCFTDDSIQRFIKANLTEGKCSYCGHSNGSSLIAASVDEVLSFISIGLSREYDIPENCLPWDSEEGGWQLATPDDSYDLIRELDICSETSGDLLDDIVGAFSGRQFVRRDPLTLSEAEGLKYSWDAFCEHTKHETRFVFFRDRQTRRPKNQLWSQGDDLNKHSPPHWILLGLGEIVKRHQLIKKLPKGTEIFRARQHEATVSYTTAETLGTPPKHRASQSRMSPAGIPMFYGAGDIHTALVEIYDYKDAAKDTVTVGTFETTRQMSLLDLTDLPRVPSIFNSSLYDLRPPLIFLRHFQREVSEPVERDGREHYEYVPTQIVAEYFRQVFRFNRRRIDGIKFKSSRSRRGVCYCIFADANACTDGPNPKREHLLLLRSHVSALSNNAFDYSI